MGGMYNPLFSSSFISAKLEKFSDKDIRDSASETYDGESVISELDQNFLFDPVVTLLQTRNTRGAESINHLSSISYQMNSAIDSENLELPLGWHMPRISIEKMNQLVVPSHDECVVAEKYFSKNDDKSSSNQSFKNLTFLNCLTLHSILDIRGRIGARKTTYSIKAAFGHCFLYQNGVWASIWQQYG